MSVETQRAIANADAAGSKLTQAQKDLQAALDEHFGKGIPGPEQAAQNYRPQNSAVAIAEYRIDGCGAQDAN